MARTYRLNKRAKQREATRLSIIQATVDLHETLGPAATTISAVAERAGVRRATVYSHFPSEPDLLEACKNHWMNLNPLPDPKVLLEPADPEVRLEITLREFYGYYERNESMLGNVFRDAEIVPQLAENLESLRSYYDALVEGLARDWSPPPSDRDLLLAAIGHSLDFYTWRSLTHDRSLPRNRAVDMMALLVRAAAGRCEEGRD